MKIVVLARALAPQRQSEALRAALGLTLRGATVVTFVEGPLQTPLAERAAATLRSFGHPVAHAIVPADLAAADAIEVWTDEVPEPVPELEPVPAATLSTLHLVRSGAHPRLPPGDWLVDLDRRQLADRGTPPLPPGPITYDQLVDLIAAARRVVTW